MFSFSSLLIISALVVLSQAELKNFTLDCEVSGLCDKKEKFCELFCEIKENFTPDVELNIQQVNVKGNVGKNGGISVTFESAGMTTTIPREIGKKIPGLSSLTITNSRLSSTKRIDFTSMPHLKILDLSSNQITSIAPETFQNLTALENLAIHDNKISHLRGDALFPLTALRIFSAEYNTIERLEAGTFRYNIKLEQISLQGNNLKSLNEDFVRLTALNFVDLRDNSELCRNCPVLSVEAYEKRLAGCKIDKVEGESAMKKNFEACIQTKIGEKDEIKSKLDGCFTMKKNVLEKSFQNFTKCSEGLGISITNIGIVDKCIAVRISEELRTQDAFESCVANQASKEPKITELLQNCYEGRNERQTQVKKAFGSCTYCHKMSESENEERCQVRFVKDYGNQVVDFQANVKKFFKS